MRCPGQNTQFLKPDDIFEISCEQCGHSVEFFKDDASRFCPSCGSRIANPKFDVGCAQWCKHAKECLGLDPQLQQPTEQSEISLRNRLVDAMKNEFGDDQKRINHALLVLERAEEILYQEGGDPRVVIAAALLHDIGIQEAERKHGSSIGRYQQIEGPPIARRIMTAIGMDEPTIDHVCRIVGNHHSARGIDTLEFRILWDADWLVNIADEFAGVGKNKLKNIINKVFKTSAGKRKAYKLFIQPETDAEISVPSE